jgi:hypothetical protein
MSGQDTIAFALACVPVRHSGDEQYVAPLHKNEYILQWYRIQRIPTVPSQGSSRAQQIWMCQGEPRPKEKKSMESTL